jgi:hypothetical protein
VKFFIEFDEIIIPAGVGGTLLTQKQEPEIVDIVGAHYLGPATHGDLLERFSHLEYLCPVLGRKSAHIQLSPSSYLKQTFSQETLKRLVHWGLRHSERSSDL